VLSIVPLGLIALLGKEYLVQAALAVAHAAAVNS